MLMRDLYAHIISILHGATNADTDKYRIVDTEEKREAFTNALREWEATWRILLFLCPSR